MLFCNLLESGLRKLLMTPSPIQAGPVPGEFPPGTGNAVLS